MNDIDYIQTVKIQGDSYLVNGTTSVPKADGNRHYEDLKLWLVDNTPEPEFTDEELALQEQAKINSEALSYLASTDWYITRLSETGVAVPQEILDARQVAREKIV